MPAICSAQPLYAPKGPQTPPGSVSFTLLKVSSSLCGSTYVNHLIIQPE